MPDARAITVPRMLALGLSGFILDAEESNAVESLISRATKSTSRLLVKPSRATSCNPISSRTCVWLERPLPNHTVAVVSSLSRVYESSWCSFFFISVVNLSLYGYSTVSITRVQASMAFPKLRSWCSSRFSHAVLVSMINVWCMDLPICASLIKTVVKLPHQC
jgi:hypothetical protein